jgi:hypothetical protein
MIFYDQTLDGSGPATPPLGAHALIWSRTPAFSVFPWRALAAVLQVGDHFLREFF